MQPESKETEVESSDQKASPSPGTNTGVVLFSAIFVHGIMSLQLSLVVWIFLRSLGVVTTDQFPVRCHKNHFKDSCLMNSQPAFLFLLYFNFESHNSINLSFSNICSLHSNFVDCESFLESNSLDILTLPKTQIWMT